MNLFSLIFAPLRFFVLNIWPAIIAAGAALAGGALSAKGSESAGDAALASRNLELLQQQNMHLDNIALQREFAQMGVQWRVQDAVNAGLHPLYALGANTPTYSPSVAAGVSPADMGNPLGELGQGISRAGAYISDAFREQALDNSALQNRVLEAQANEIEMRTFALASDLARQQQAAATWQAYPYATDAYLGVDRFMADYVSRDRYYPGGYTQQGPVQMQPSKSVHAYPGEPWREAATDVPLTKEFRTRWGNILLPGTEATEALESMEPWGVGLIIGENLAYYGEKGVRRLLNHAVDKGWTGWAGIIGRYLKQKGELKR